MPELGNEIVLSEQCFLKRDQQCLIKVNGSATLPADKVVMMPLVGRVIAEPAPTEVCLGHQVEFLQQFQCPINRGDIDIGEFGYHLGIHLFGADVVIAVLDGLKYHQPLRCQTISLLTQRAGYISYLLHVTSPGLPDLHRVFPAISVEHHTTTGRQMQVVADTYICNKRWQR